MSITVRKPDPESIDDDAPEWTDEMFSGAKSFDQSDLPESFKQAVRRGRPCKDKPKIPLSVRFSPEVVEFFRSTGKGWQTRMDDVLKEYVSRHSSISPGSR